MNYNIPEGSTGTDMPKSFKGMQGWSIWRFNSSA